MRGSHKDNHKSVSKSRSCGTASRIAHINFRMCKMVFPNCRRPPTKEQKYAQDAENTLPTEKKCLANEAKRYVFKEGHFKPGRSRHTTGDTTTDSRVRQLNWDTVTAK